VSLNVAYAIRVVTHVGGFYPLFDDVRDVNAVALMLVAVGESLRV
jgi:hypothetical protein